MKCQNLFTGKKYETYFKMSSAAVLPSMLSVKSNVQTNIFIYLFYFFMYITVWNVEKYYALTATEILMI